MQEAGIRAFIGKLSMDVSSRPTYKEPSAQEAIASAISFNQKMQSTFSHLSSSNRLRLALGASSSSSLSSD